MCAAGSSRPADDGQGGINEERLLKKQNGLLIRDAITKTCISSDFDAATADGKIIIDGNDATAPSKTERP